jgi:hypothetical protein
MDKQLTQEETSLVGTEKIKLRVRTPEERRAFIQGRISGLGTALDLIKGNFMERIAILREIEEKDLEK